MLVKTEIPAGDDNELKVHLTTLKHPSDEVLPSSRCFFRFSATFMNLEIVSLSSNATLCANGCGRPHPSPVTKLYNVSVQDHFLHRVTLLGSERLSMQVKLVTGTQKVEITYPGDVFQGIKWEKWEVDTRVTSGPGFVLNLLERGKEGSVRKQVAEEAAMMFLVFRKVTTKSPLAFLEDVQSRMDFNN